MVLHEFTSLMQQHLISKAIRPLDWIQTHPKSVPSSFLGVGILPQELTIEMTGSPDNHIVGANGIPRRCMSSPWWPPLHLLRQSWGPYRLLLMAVRQSRWILKQLGNADLKVNADIFDILRTYTRCAWAGGTFFQLCCCVSFWFWQEIGFGFTYYYLCT